MSMFDTSDNPDHLYRLLIQGVAEYAIYMIDPQGIVKNWNAGAERAKGYKAEEIIGSNFSRFYSQSDQDSGLPQRALETARSRGNFKGEGWRIRKDGTRFWAHVVIDPISVGGELIGFTKITQDLTQQRLSQQVNERKFELLVNGATDYMMFMVDPSGAITSWNDGAERATGYDAQDILGHNFSLFYSAAEIADRAPQKALESARREGKSETEGWRYCKGDKRFWAHIVVEPVRDHEGALIGFANITQDLSEQKRQATQVQNLSRNLDLALSNISQALCLFDAEGSLVLSNPRLSEMFGLSHTQSQPGIHFNDIMRSIFGRGADQNPSLRISRSEEASDPNMLRIFSDSATTDINIRDRIISVSHRILPTGGWVSTMDDISERRKIEGRVAHLAHHDALTGLPNRILIQRRLEELLDANRGNSSCALLYLDLDKFKPVNDSLGHAAGDELLCAVAGRLLEALREGDMVARIGGDEFVILQANSADSIEASVLAERVLEKLSIPFSLRDAQVIIGVSIGIALAPKDGGDSDLLLRNADLALYRAKSDGRNCVRCFRPEMETLIHQRRDFEIDLRNALSNNEMELYYQPIVSVDDCSLTGFEALLRWNSPTRGQVPPVEFIPFAEEIGLMPAIGEWVLEMACHEAAKWDPPIRVSVNVSPTQFRSDGLVQNIQSTLKRAGLPAYLLELEVTETAMIQDIGDAHATLKEIGALGVLIALDDFGTGYSSLSFLRTLPFTRVKIDRSFIKDLTTKKESTAIVKAVTAMCVGLGVAVTAEGVETVEQADILKSDSPMEIQGYWISRPRPANEVPGLIARLAARGEPNRAVTMGNLSPDQLIGTEQELGSDRSRPDTRRVDR